MSSDIVLPVIGSRTRAVRWRALARVLNPAALGVATLTILAGALRFTRLGHQGFWFDEGNTALLVHFSAGKMLGLLPQSESTPPLYYCLAWAWARVFGYGEVGLRSLSALVGALAVPIAYGAGAKLISVRAGLIAAALTACNAYVVWYSQEARSYSVLLTLTAAALMAFAYARATPTPTILLAWVIASALSLATHYYAILAIVPEALWLLALHRRKRSVQIALAAVAACGLALIPLAISQSGTGHASWIAPIGLDGRLQQLLPNFLIGFQMPTQQVLLRAGELVVLGALVLLALRSEPLERRAAIGLGALVLGGLALNLVLIAGGIDDLISRNAIALWMPGALLVAAGLGARRAGWLGLAGAATLCAIGIVGVVGVATDRRFERPDWRVVAGMLGAQPSSASAPRAILIQHYRALLPLSLYVSRLQAWPRATASIGLKELDIVSFSAPRVHLCWWGGACNLSGTRVQHTYRIPGFRELWRKRELQFTVIRMQAAHPVPVTQVLVAHALTATHYVKDELLIQPATAPRLR